MDHSAESVTSDDLANAGFGPAFTALLTRYHVPPAPDRRPEPTWPALAAAKLFRASLTNLDAYRAKVGDIDESLGALLLNAGVIHTNDSETGGPGDEEDDRTATHATAAATVLNARRGIPHPEDRVRLVRTLRLSEPLAATQITQEESNLFALLLEHELVPDDAATFTHVHGAGWTAVEPAILASNGIKQFLTPNLINGMVGDVFDDPQTSSKIGQQVLDALAVFLPTDDSKALAAAAKFAVQSDTVLPIDQIRRVANTSKDANLTVRLLQIAAPAANEVTTVLSELGGEYSYLTTWERGEFEVPYDEAHRAVFKIAADANLCQISKKPRKDLLVVKHP